MGTKTLRSVLGSFFFVLRMLVLVMLLGTADSRLMRRGYRTLPASNAPSYPWAHDLLDMQGDPHRRDKRLYEQLLANLKSDRHYKAAEPEHQARRQEHLRTKLKDATDRLNEFNRHYRKEVDRAHAQAKAGRNGKQRVEQTDKPSDDRELPTAKRAKTMDQSPRPKLEGGTPERDKDRGSSEKLGEQSTSEKQGPTPEPLQPSRGQKKRQMDRPIGEEPQTAAPPMEATSKPVSPEAGTEMPLTKLRKSGSRTSNRESRPPQSGSAVEPLGTSKQPHNSFVGQTGEHAGSEVAATLNEAGSLSRQQTPSPPQGRPLTVEERQEQQRRILREMGLIRQRQQKQKTWEQIMHGEKDA